MEKNRKVYILFRLALGGFVSVLMLLLALAVLLVPLAGFLYLLGAEPMEILSVVAFTGLLSISAALLIILEIGLIIVGSIIVAIIVAPFFQFIMKRREQDGRGQ